MNTPFLQSVTEDLFRKTGGDLSRTVVVFPSKRAGLYMNEYLLRLSGDRPTWAPRYTTISELFETLAPDLTVADRIDTALHIVRLFEELTEQTVSVDWFYGWAERILDDFEDVDKNMVDAEALFQNLNDLKEIEQQEFLTDEQKAVLQRFFTEFDPQHNDVLRERYRQLWNVLAQLYVRLNATLLEKGEAYEGALYRRVVERLGNGETELDATVEHYAFVGFNLLDRVEKTLFRLIKDEGKAWFYWDYDDYYVRSAHSRNHEAGMFLRENLEAFPNELPKEDFDHLAQQKEIVMAAASTEAIQAQYAGEWVRENLTPDHRRTAVVLCNEGILQPVLHALPEEISEVNITKGFPLAHTEAVTLVEKRFSRWEREQTTLGIAELLERLTEEVRTNAHDFVTRQEFSEARFEDVLQSEAYYMLTRILEHFSAILLRHLPDLKGAFTLVTLRRLLRQTVRNATIPFSGEPVVGLQVMGVLETRCLDFERIIMLSVNDGTLPKKADHSSFVPYLLRRAFGMTTPERKTAVFAYYFYRLLQRAEHVTMTYNSAATLSSTGEMSRFMTQLLVEWPHPVTHLTLNSMQAPMLRRPEDIAKPHDLLQRLTKKEGYGVQLSPSAINAYLRCQLLFYYNHVMGIKEPEPDPEEIQPNVLGTIFHHAAELIYKKPEGAAKRLVMKEEIETLLKSPERLRQIVRQAFDDEKTAYRLLQARVVEMFLKTLLRYDAAHAPFHILATEYGAGITIEATLPDGTTKVPVRIGGNIDRIDDIDAGNGIRILDYKTGGKEESATSLEELFQQGKNKHYMLQTFLYALMMADKVKAPIVPSLFFVNHAARKGYDPRLTMGGKDDKDFIDDFHPYRKEFVERLQTLLGEMLDPTQPFHVPEKENICASCAYFPLCYK